MAVETLTDPTHGQVRRETGIGHVVEFTHEEGKRNAYVRVQADGLRHPVGGWIDTHTAPLEMLDVAGASLAEGRRVRYRIDVHAKRGVELAGRGLDDLAKDEKVRDLVALELVGNHEVTSGAQVPQDGPGAPSAESDAPTPSSPPAAQNGADPADVPPPSDDDAPAAGAPARRGPKLEEAKPWDELASDGSPNLGSYAVIATTSVVELAWEMLVDLYGRRESDEAKPPTVAQARGLGRRLLFCADRVQAAIRPDGRVDRMASSHTRARGAVRSALTLHTPPWGATGDAIGDWMNELTMTAVGLVQGGLDLLMEFER